MPAMTATIELRRLDSTTNRGLKRSVMPATTATLIREWALRVKAASQSLSDASDDCDTCLVNFIRRNGLRNALR